MYDFDGDKEWEKAFFDSINHSVIQHIKGEITRIDGEKIILDETNLLNSVHYDSQCTKDENVFNFGEMYIGSAEIKASLPDENINLIKNGELRLFFRTESVLKWIPLGVWDIVAAERGSGKVFTIKGYDHLNRLNTPVTDGSVGAIFIKSALRQVTKDAGVEFAQTIEEIQQVAGSSVDIINGLWATHFLDTCWDEVKAIAQFLGCFAFANREGKIEFRRFASHPLMEIPADKRFSAKISDYQYSIKGISYTNTYGNTITYTENSDRCILGFSENKYIWESENNPEDEYINSLKRIAHAVGCYSNDLLNRKWSPGIVEYYGNPALDVGDMIELSGSVSNNVMNFLITHISWQFRGKQTLISGGAPETSTTVSSGSYGSSESVTSYTTINTTNNISAINLKTYLGEFFAEKIIAKGNFSCVHEMWIFINVNTVIKGNTTFTSIVHIDGIQQNLQPVQTVNGYATVDFSLPVKVNGGKHTIEISANGTAEIEQIQAIVWGQELKEEMPDITEDSDYTYTIKNSLTTVTGYKGVSLYPSIPDDLGGGKTAVIGYGAFAKTVVENVYIPDGVAEIK